VLFRSLGAKAILVPTFTGRTASAVARLRPRRPVVALTHVVTSLQHMAIEWGVTPLEIPESTDVNFLTGSVNGLPVPDESVDVLVAFDCLEHVMSQRIVFMLNSIILFDNPV